MSGVYDRSVLDVDSLAQESAPCSENSPREENTATSESRAGGIGRAATLMTILIAAANGCNYASNIVFGHLLSAAQFGDLTALLALTMILTVPTGAAQTIVAERVASLKAIGEEERLRYLIRHAGAHVLTLALTGGVLYLACVPLVKSELGLPGYGPAVVLAPLLTLTLFLPVAYGVLQGLQRFVAMGAMMLLVAISRIAFGLPWVLASGGAGGPLLGQAIGTGAALLVSGWLVRHLLIGRGTGAARSGARRIPNRRTLTAGGAFVAWALLSNLDVILAKMLLSPREAGVYAALANVEKVVIFLPAAVAVVVVPQAARAKAEHRSVRPVLRSAAAFVAAGALLGVLPVTLAPHLVLRLMFGAKYQAAAGGVPPIAIAGAALALLYLLVVYTVAIQDRHWSILLLVGVVAQIAAILAVHSSPIAIAYAQASVMVGVLAVNEVVFHPLLHSRPLLNRPSSP
jgi:O-antigen/teichoic acid export membrane protein